VPKGRAMEDPQDAHGHQDSLPTLAVGALGVVFGDIGTSPLYALKESFVGHHPLAVDRAAYLSVCLSLIFWTMTLIVTAKYVFIVMRADNHGEGRQHGAAGAYQRANLGQTRWSANDRRCSA
jgi:KUP system potassium uptake protein